MKKLIAFLIVTVLLLQAALLPAMASNVSGDPRTGVGTAEVDFYESLGFNDMTAILKVYSTKDGGRVERTDNSGSGFNASASRSYKAYANPGYTFVRWIAVAEFGGSDSVLLGIEQYYNELSTRKYFFSQKGDKTTIHDSITPEIQVNRPFDSLTYNRLTIQSYAVFEPNVTMIAGEHCRIKYYEYVYYNQYHGYKQIRYSSEFTGQKTVYFPYVRNEGAFKSLYNQFVLLPTVFFYADDGYELDGIGVNTKIGQLSVSSDRSSANFSYAYLTGPQTVSVSARKITCAAGLTPDGKAFDTEKEGYADIAAQAVTVDGVALKAADYSKVAAAIAKIPDNLSVYTDATVKVLNGAKNAVVYGRSITEQAEVDGYTQAIQQAVDGLVKKPAAERPDTPQTRDSSGMPLWIALSLVSGAALAALGAIMKRRKTNS